MQIATKAYKVIKTANTNSYTLYLQGQNSVYMNELYESITKTDILSSAFYNEADNDQDQDQDSILFTAETVKPLSAFLKKGKLTNQETIKMIHDLSKQIAYLETKMQQTFYGYNLDDLLVINDDTFFIASTKILATIERKNNSIYF